MKDVLEKVTAALKAAQEHLEYCGYGDAWERGCAMEAKLPRQIDEAIQAANEVLEQESSPNPWRLLKDDATKSGSKLRAALLPFAQYAEKRLAKPIPGLGNSVHSIHVGTEFEAHITLEHCVDALKVLENKSCV